MYSEAASSRKYAVHGLAVEIVSDISDVGESAHRALSIFETDDLPQGIPTTAGILRPYEANEVIRHLSPSAVPLATPGNLLELYQEGERFWLVDDRWGLCELNVMRSVWRSWILPRPTLDPVRLLEMAVLWPMAQLLRPKGLWLIPGAAVARGGSGILVLCPFNIEGELRSLIKAGYKIIGQRWCAVREDAGRIELLHLPGQIEREASPRLSNPGSGPVSRYVDLAEEFCGVIQPHSLCETVLIVEPARRPNAQVTQVAAQRASDLMRRSWPITELHPFRKHGQLPLRLANLCSCWQVQLSRQADDLLVLLDSIRDTSAVSLNLTSAALSPPAPLRLAM